jgi:hypothetical protein
MFEGGKSFNAAVMMIKEACACEPRSGQAPEFTSQSAAAASAAPTTVQ